MPKQRIKTKVEGYIDALKNKVQTLSYKKQTAENNEFTIEADIIKTHIESTNQIIHDLQDLIK